MTARVVKTREAADALPSGVVVRDAGGGVALTVAGGFVSFGSAHRFERARLALPLTVLWPPPDDALPAPQRYDQCDTTCTVDCGHCKGNGPPTPSSDTLRDEIAAALADGVLPITERVRADARREALEELRERSRRDPLTFGALHDQISREARP